MNIGNVSAAVLSSPAPSRLSVPINGLDTRVKQGLYRQMQAFLSDHPENTVQRPLANYVLTLRDDFLPLIGCA